MITDIYSIDEKESSVAGAVEGLAKAGALEGMGDAAIAHLKQLTHTLVQIGRGLTQVGSVELWMETKAGEAIVHLKADCAVDIKEEEELKTLSTTGANTERKGIFAKIRGFFDEGAIADNEQLHEFGYIPEVDPDGYPVFWTFQSELPVVKDHWDKQAAADIKGMTSSIDVGFDSNNVEIAAHMKYS